MNKNSQISLFALVVSVLPVFVYPRLISSSLVDQAVFYILPPVLLFVWVFREEPLKRRAYLAIAASLIANILNVLLAELAIKVSSLIPITDLEPLMHSTTILAVLAVAGFVSWLIGVKLTLKHSPKA